MLEAPHTREDREQTGDERMVQRVVRGDEGK